MEDLHHNIYEWCGVPPKEQHIVCEGFPLPPDIKLRSMGNGATLTVIRSMHSRGTLKRQKQEGTWEEVGSTAGSVL